MLPINHLTRVTIATPVTIVTLAMSVTPAASARPRIHTMAAIIPIGARIHRDHAIGTLMSPDRVIEACAIRWMIRGHLFNCNAAVERRRHPVGSDAIPVAMTTCALTRKASLRLAVMGIAVARGIMGWRSARAERRAQIATTNGVEAASLDRREVHGVRNQTTILTMTIAGTMMIAWARNIIVPHRRRHRIPVVAPTWNAATMLVADAAMAMTTAPNVGRAVTGIQAEARSWSGIGNAAAIAAMPEGRLFLNHS